MKMIKLLNDDCMNVMAQYPDKYFDLAIVDPPYGIGITNSNRLVAEKGWENKGWDNHVPDSNYFEELKRVSKDQIIWGGNYFISNLSSSKCFLIWDKKNDGRDFADCEFAWTSLNTVARIFRMRPQNMDGGKIHPTQKPIDLYKWLLDKYAQPNYKILDTHLGSGSIAIACHYFGCDLVATEIDKDYYDAAVKRFAENTKQTTLF